VPHARKKEPVTAEALEKSVLESKDREQLIAIAQALGVKSVSRAKKADIIQKILEQTGGSEAPATNGASTAVENASTAAAATPPASDRVVLGPDGEPLPEWEVELIRQGVALEASVEPTGPAAAVPEVNGPEAPTKPADQRPQRQQQPGQQGGQHGGGQRQHDDDGDGEGRNRRRRRRRNRGGRADEGPQGPDRELLEDGPVEPVSNEPVTVAGYLDLRDEGYGFLRVKGYLHSKEDAYVSVRQTRQYGLRKGDYVTGLCRPAARNEKNPALIEVHTVNGKDPEALKGRPRFEDLTPLFPDEKLRLEGDDPSNMTARIIDLIAPIGKGQRGLIVSPPKAGKTTIMKTIATSIERNNPEVRLIVLLIDERPEEVTDMRRTVKGEVIASTFDRPSDEHTTIAEMAIEKAKRLVEMGEDVVIILDGITRLSRAYNLAAPASGRIMSGGIDAGALYPPKKFFGAARNVEEGGSLTILATALVETNSRMDDAIFEEFKGTGNMELRLDRKISERRIFPAIDVDASSTRHEELLFDRKQLQMVWKLRRVLSGLAADGNAAPGLELLMDRLKSFRTNDEFLNEIAKQPSM
jgi:transcription termination factor Rho